MSTREKIIKAAVTLFVERGVARTTTREIASSASVAEGSIYRYFPSKEELAWQIFNDYHQHLATCLSDCSQQANTIEEKINSLVQCFLQMADEDWLMFQYYITSQHTHMKRIENTSITPYQVVLEIMQIARENNQIISGNLEIMAAMVMGAIHQIAINKIFSRINGSLLQHHHLVTETVCKMLLER